MTSKQELEKLIENILEQGKVVTVNPDLILNVNVENFIPIIERACEELDRVEELKKDIVTTYKSNKQLREENAKLKNVIEILKDRFEIVAVKEDYDSEYIIETSTYFLYITKEQYELLREVLGHDI